MTRPPRRATRTSAGGCGCVAMSKAAAPNLEVGWFVQQPTALAYPVGRPFQDPLDRRRRRAKQFDGSGGIAEKCGVRFPARERDRPAKQLCEPGADLPHGEDLRAG